MTGKYKEGDILFLKEEGKCVINWIYPYNTYPYGITYNNCTGKVVTEEYINENLLYGPYIDRK